MNETDTRKLAEADFHDQRERDRRRMTDAEFLARYPNKRFYENATPHNEHLGAFIEQHAPGADALDYCCGVGLTSMRLARAGATVQGIDISPQSVQTAERRCRKAGLGETTSFQVMDAESLDFPDDSFDLIVCVAVLHHLDVEKAYPELARVLRPGGRILCVEALGYNPFIRAYRKLTPHLRTEWEVDHILTRRELELARRFFDDVVVDYFYLASIPGLALPDGRAFDLIRQALFGVDKMLLKIPGVQLLAWQMVFALGKPKPA